MKIEHKNFTSSTIFLCKKIRGLHAIYRGTEQDLEAVRLMARERTLYSNAPVVEAIIDLKVAQPPGLSIEDLRKLVQENSGQYPIMEEEYRYQGGAYVAQAGEPMRHESEHWHSGFRCISGDKRRIYFIRLDGFAFSVRAPYERWESFRDEARRLWEAYRSASNVNYVTRIAVRYINRIDIPQRGYTGMRLEDYITIYPELPEDFPPNGTMSQYFLQLQVPQNDIESMLVINSTPEAPPVEGVSSVILDFDLFRETAEQPWEGKDDATVWSFLEKLHERKNEIFEASITDRTRELIQ